MSNIRTTALLSTLLAANAQAQAPAAEEKSLETVTVQGARIEQSSEATKAYKVEKTDGATRMDISTQETPQTVNVVTRQQMEDFGLSNAREVLAATPGVVVGNQETDRTSYYSRGSEISNFQVDGLGIPFDDYNYQGGDIDSVIYDRIEVVKGANGLTSSLGDPGGTVNFVRKRPTKNFQTSLGLNYGSWNTKRVEADVSGSLHEKVRARLVAAAQDGEWYLDNYKLKKHVFAATVEAPLTSTTTLTLGHTQQTSNPKGNNWGALPLIDQSGKQLEYDRSYNPVPSWEKWDRTNQNSFIELKEELTPNVTFKATYQLTAQDEDAALVYYFGAPDANGDGVSVYPALYTVKGKQTIADVNLSGTFPVAGVDHDFVVGASTLFNNDKQKSWAATPPTINWNGWDGQFAKPEFTADGSEDTTADSTQRLTSLYAAVRIHATDALRILIGANQAKAKSEGYSYGTPTDYDKSKTMPYAGITYNINPNYTVYTSYSTIFRPQSSVDTDGNLIDPVQGLATELGVKGSWLDDALTGSVAYFKTEQNDYPLRPSDSASIIKQYIVGDLRTEGFELNAAGKITDQTNLIAGYTQVKMKDAKSGEETRTYMPSQVFNILVTQQIIPGLKVGAGLNWLSDTHLDVEATVYHDDGTETPYAGRIKQDSYALLNLMASYELNKNLSFQFNADNVTNEEYLNSFPDAQGFYGAPANYTVGVQLSN